mgnify:CR=1 FL=1
MKIMGLAGWSGSGKTTLLAKLIPALTALGATVSTVKHAHHNFDVDQPGKDSHTHRLAGAAEVLISSTARWALMHELRGADEPSLADLIAHMSPVDLLLVEGFKRDSHRTIEIHRPELGKELLYRGDPDIVAVASTGALPELTIPVLDLDDIDAIARFVIENATDSSPPLGGGEVGRGGGGSDAETQNPDCPGISAGQHRC